LKLRFFKWISLPFREIGSDAKLIDQASNPIRLVRLPTLLVPDSDLLVFCFNLIGAGAMAIGIGSGLIGF
jgi:hypothetical protein